MQVLTESFPNFNASNNLVARVFGCVAFVHIHLPQRSKLDPRALKCVFLGYSSTQKGYKCYHPPTRQYYVSADVTFAELTPYFHQDSSQKDQDTSEHNLVPELPVLCPQIVDLPVQSQQPDQDPPQIIPDQDPPQIIPDQDPPQIIPAHDPNL